MIQWTKESEEAVENLPLPPMLGSYARLECERLARKKGLNSVTPEIVAEADPIWCPNNQAPTPGSNGCTATYTSLGDLLTYLDANEQADALLTVEVRRKPILAPPNPDIFEIPSRWQGSNPPTGSRCCPIASIPPWFPRRCGSR